MSRDAEEDSLFFVAMSRARDTLFLSRALTNGKASTPNPSRFLNTIAAHLPTALNRPARWTAEGLPEPERPLLAGQPASSVWTARAIETYLDCPRRFYYDHVLNLGGDEDQSPYLKFQSSLHTTIAWLRATSSIDERRTGLAARFEDDWRLFGPAGHAFESLYRGSALRMVENAAQVMDGESLVSDRTVMLPQTGATVTCRADHIQLSSQGIVVRRLKTSRLSTKETHKARYTLWQLAVRRDHPGQNVLCEHVSLIDGERQSMTVEPRKLQNQLEDIEAAVKAVSNGSFDPAPGTRCPTCPYYMACPAHGALR